MLRFGKPKPQPMYEFKDTTLPVAEKHRKNRSRSEDDASGASLTYSAASSMGNESTDSSFAEFRRVIEGDSQELATFLKKHVRTDEKSFAGDSLAYSTDAETWARSHKSEADSQLQGTAIVSQQGSSRTGQGSSAHNPSALSASYLKNGGGQGSDDFAMFSPAEHTESMKRRKEKKRRDRRMGENPHPSEGAENYSSNRAESRTPQPTTRPPPHSPERGAAYTSELDDDDDLWYAKWWMFCFPEMNLKNVSPKR